MRRFTVWVIGMQLSEGVKFSDGHIVVYQYKRKLVAEYTNMIELVMDSYIIQWLDADDSCLRCGGTGEVLLGVCPSCCNPLGRPLKEGESLPTVK